MTIKIGDKVSWTHVSGSGSTVSMKLREGTVTAIDVHGIATVKPSSKAKSVQVAISRLRTPRQKSQITEFIEAVKEANRVSQ